MTALFSTSPAHTLQPGASALQDGAVFGAVFHDCKSCGLVLYHLPDQEEFLVPFSDEYRIGSLYSVKITGIKPEEWAYRYYRDDVTFIDPYAHKLMSIDAKEGEQKVCCLFPYAEDTLPYTHTGAKTPWADRVIYQLHVRGFTASRSSKAPHRGTFKGAAEKIPYLKKLGVTAVELMPVYELRCSIPGSPAEGEETGKVNFWNFGEGCYFAPKAAYAAGNEAQKEFRAMVEAFHDAGIEVYLQLYFTDTVRIQTQVETARFYVTHYQIDGFRLMGSGVALTAIASDPILTDTALIYYSFPYEELQKENKENPSSGKPPVAHLAESTNSFSRLVRKFVKSDDQVTREFAKAFVSVPAGHGDIHYAASYEGFTLMDLVSYNWKHNEENGENNNDGEDDNLSWNCGVEGKTGKKDIRSLRIRQVKNFLLLNFLAQGTPLLRAGDERCNSQGGNNNPYCQDNETGWVSWKETVDSRNVLEFTEKISAFRRDHAIFRRKKPFSFSDYEASGFPDVSFHGQEAWKPDFGGHSHSIGIMYNEAYAQENPAPGLIYLAINAHWHSQQFGVPTPPAGWRWRVIADTFEQQSFHEEPPVITDQRHVSVHGRSILILRAVREFDPKAAKKSAPEEKTATPQKNDNE